MEESVPIWTNSPAIKVPRCLLLEVPLPISQPPAGSPLAPSSAFRFNMCIRVRESLELGRCPPPPRPPQRPGLSLYPLDSRFLGAQSSPGSLQNMYPVNSPQAAGVLWVYGAGAGTPTYLHPSGWRHHPTPIQLKLFLRLQLSSGEIQHLPNLDSLPDGVSSFSSHQGSRCLLLETPPSTGPGPTLARLSPCLHL